MVQHTQGLIGEHARVEETPVPPLTGSWLRSLQKAWVLMAAAALLILLTSLPGYAQNFGGQHFAPAAQSAASILLIALSKLASLASALLSLALSALFFRRRFTELVAAGLSFYLLLYAIVMAGPLETWSAYWLGDDGLAEKLQGLLVAMPSVALFALFPNGRFIPRWTRWLLLLSVLWSISFLFLPPFEAVASRPATATMTLLAAGLIALFVAGLLAQVYRYRYTSSPAERQQTKWVVYGFTLWLGYCLLSSIPYFYLMSLAPHAPIPWWGSVSVLGWYLSLNIVPVSLAIAVTRYRMWDIDVVMNRTLVYGTLTAVVVSIYALVVGGMGIIFQTQGNSLITLVATGMVAVLFQPLHDRLQRGVNQLLYGHRDEPFEVLARLGQRLEDTFAPDLMLPVMVETIGQTLKLPYVAFAVRQGRGFHTVKAYGIPVGTVHTYPLTYQGAVIGQLLVAQRSPHEAFTTGEERLLRSIAGQAGTALHAVRLTADLQRARQQIVTSREEERRRLRRDLHDGLGPSLAAQLLKIGSARALQSDRPEITDRLLSEVETDITDTLAEVRRIVYNLRPPPLDQLGLVGALRAFAETCESAECMRIPSSLAICVDVPDPLPALPAAVEVAAYHIAREGLTNVVRHAEAQRCTVRLVVVDAGSNASLHLTVEDDGRGFAEGVLTGVGLTALHERAAELSGTCTVASMPGVGTRITVVLPLGV